jgi:hypothetical protein
MDDKRDVNKFDDLDLLMRALLTGDGSSAIEWQEKSGQQSFVGSDTLPTDMQDNAQLVLEAAGVKFLGIVENDPMFQYVELPTGWKKEGTSHSMHSNLLDEKGRKRAGIFYKAAVYDRSAHLHVDRRFSHTNYHEDIPNGVRSTVLDGDKVIWQSEIMTWAEDTDWSIKGEIRESVGAQAGVWLDTHYPNWRDASAYWNEES